LAKRNIALVCKDKGTIERDLKKYKPREKTEKTLDTRTVYGRKWATAIEFAHAGM